MQSNTANCFMSLGPVACIINVNYTSSVVNKLEALLTDDARVVIYDHHMFIVQAIGLKFVCKDGVQNRTEFCLSANIRLG